MFLIKIKHKASDIKNTISEKVENIIEGDKTQKGLGDKISETYHKVTDTLNSAAEKIGLKNKHDDSDKNKH